MRKLFLLAALATSTFTYGQSWTPTAARTAFTAKMFGVKVVGTFKGFKGNVNFDPSNLAQSSITGSVDAATIDTDNSLRDGHLREKEDFFQVEKYPRVTLKSTKIEKSGSDYVGTFDLTLKNVTKSVRIPFTFQESGSTATLEGSTKLDRTDWKFGGNTLGMSDDVKID
uniref:YceI family protein n=1 Tax=Persicitalea sp. TaxID=3100273 RepID=UPI0035943AD7